MMIIVIIIGLAESSTMAVAGINFSVRPHHAEGPGTKQPGDQRGEQ